MVGHRALSPIASYPIRPVIRLCLAARAILTKCVGAQNCLACLDASAASLSGSVYRIGHVSPCLGKCHASVKDEVGGRGAVLYLGCQLFFLIPSSKTRRRMCTRLKLLKQQLSQVLRLFSHGGECGSRRAVAGCQVNSHVRISTT